MKLLSQNYGKSRVRVLKVLKDGATHTIKELSVRVALQGDFDASYTAADNALVVPTDTVKNTINVLAHDHLAVEIQFVEGPLADQPDPLGGVIRPLRFRSVFVLLHSGMSLGGAGWRGVTAAASSCAAVVVVALPPWRPSGRPSPGAGSPC